MDNQGLWPGWEIRREIGRGSYGRVYEMERRLYDYTEKAALKILRIPADPNEIEELRNDGYDDSSITLHFESYLEDIIEEYSVMARLKGHRNIVLCDDVRYSQHENGIGWDIRIKMELLTPILKLPADHFEEEEIIRLGIDLCRALEACEKEHVIHRDIKPQNIFLSPQGDYKLGDFGIAKVTERATRGTMTGTYQYMAPEVYNRQPYGSVADLYSLGMVLYWLLNNRRHPFYPPAPQAIRASDEEKALNRRFDAEKLPPPIRGSDALKAAVLKACAYSPAERFANAAQFREALEELLEGTMVQYEVTFYDGEGKMICQKRYQKGAAITVPILRKTYSDPRYIYEFCGWNPVISPTAQRNVEYTAQYSRRRRRRWKAAAIAALLCGAIGGCVWFVNQILETDFTPVLAETNAIPQEHAAIQAELPVEIPGSTTDARLPAVKTPISAGAYYTLLILEDGRAAAVGRNDFHQGDVSSWLDIVDLDAGWDHSAGLRADGTVVACGSNGNGQCNVSGWEDIVDVDVGWLHTVGLRADGTVVAVGDNRYGQCNVSSWKDVVAVSAGFTHTVGLKADGTMVSVGENTDGECDVSSMNGMIAVYTGVDHTIGLRADGTVVAVGANDFGECNVAQWRDIVAVSASSTYTLGLKRDGTVVCAGSRLPEGFDASDWTDMVAISAGQTHAIGLRRDGMLLATGNNQFGECNVDFQVQPALVQEPSAKLEIQTTSRKILGGGFKHTVVLRKDGTVFVAGSDEDGQADVSDWENIVSVSAGELFTVGLKADGTVVATGDNTFGQCKVSDWKDIIAVSAGTRHTVGLRSDGTVVAVGESKNGQCSVSDWRDIIAVEAGYKHTVGLRSDGTVVAVGLNDEGQCNVSDWTNIAAISSEGWHTVGLKWDGTAVAVGRNQNRQCEVNHWKELVAVVAEGWHTLGLKSDGTVVAVGWDPEEADDYMQCAVESWKDIVMIAAGNDHSLGLKADGTLVSIGTSHHGQCNFPDWKVDAAVP